MTPDEIEKEVMRRRKQEWLLEALVLPESVFRDERGTIVNILNKPIGAIALIYCHANTVRSNHFHKENWHYLYVISGRMLYRERLEDGAEMTRVLSAGDMIFTPPNRPHRTEFIIDTVLLSLGNTSKDHESHEADLVRIEW